MASLSSRCNKKEANRGAWTAEEDQKLAQVIEIHGPKRWKSVAAKAGVNRCAKSCRLRWMNYLRPNIKRGNISDQEEDLILRLHKLLGNRWSLIAGRLPGRTDNEIKNYWNSHLSKKLKQIKSTTQELKLQNDSSISKGVLEKVNVQKGSEEGTTSHAENAGSSRLCSFVGDNNQLFDCYNIQEPLNLEWMSRFFEMDETWFKFS